MVDVGLIIILGFVQEFMHLEIELTTHCQGLHLIFMLQMMVMVHMTVFDGEYVLFVPGVDEDIEDCLLI